MPRAAGNQLGGITTIAAVGDTILALSTSGILYAWGDNGQGQVGNGDGTGPQSCNADVCPQPGPVVGPTGTGTLSGIRDIAEAATIASP